MEKELNFESALEQVETIVKELESGNTPLEEAIAKYTEAMKLVKVCNDKLNAATEHVNKILSENGELVDFEVQE